MPTRLPLSLVSLALFACAPGPSGPHALIGQLPAPCVGCAVVGLVDVDDDGDGSCEDAAACVDGSRPGDCDDGASDVYPGAPELADALDRDCDGVPGLADHCVGHDLAGDVDGDGWCDDLDGCPMVASGATDVDLDGLPEACDPCPGFAGAVQTDLDLDGRCDQDAADLCFGLDAYGDVDGDGRCDVSYVPLGYNHGGADLQRDALEPSLAFSSTSQRFLVVWASDISVEGQANDRFELWSRVLDAEGRPLTAPWRLTRGALDTRQPAVAWNSMDDEFLVAFGSTPQDDSEIYTLRVGPDGRPRGPSTRLTEFSGSNGTWSGANPALTFDASTRTFLVVMRGTRFMETRPSFGEGHYPEQEIFGRRVSAEGQPLGAGQWRISDIGARNIGGQDADWPSVARDPVHQRFLVAYQSDQEDDGRYEVHATLLGAQDQILAPKIAVSSMGTSSRFRPARPEVAFSETSEVYLVVWNDDVDGLAPAEEDEVYGRLIDPQGSPIGAQFRISHTGVAGDASADAADPTVVWDAASDAFVVVWRADPGTGGLAAGEQELFRQRVSPAGAVLLPADERLTAVHLDGVAGAGVVGPPALAYNPLLSDVRVVFGAKDPAWGGSAQQGVWTLDPSAPGVDADNDGVRDELDRCVGPDDQDGDGLVGCLAPGVLADCDDTDPALGADADLDGRCDALDPCPFDPADDADGDGACAHADLCLGDNTTEDLDGDGVCGDLDPCPLSAGDDADADGVCDDLDLCVGADTTGDLDSDGVCDDRDLCTTDDNDDQDGDGVPDGCDLCPQLADAQGQTDADGDGFGDACDPCPLLDHLLQGDQDGDGVCDLEVGDLCFGDDNHGDSDGDGLCDAPHRLIGLGGGPLDPDAIDGTPSVAYSEANQRFLAVWPSDSDLDEALFGSQEIWGRLLDLRGVPVGAPVQLTDVRGSYGSNTVHEVAVSANTADGSYLIAYTTSLAHQDKVFVRRVEADAQPGGPPLELSSRGLRGPSWDGGKPDVAYNPVANEHLVVFAGSARVSSGGVTTNQEIFARRVDALGRPLDSADRRISVSGPPGVVYKEAFNPAVAHGVASNRYIAVYDTNADASGAMEINASVIDAAGEWDGATVRISSMGVDPTDRNFDGELPDIAYSELSDVFLVVWQGNGGESGPYRFKTEVYGRLLNGEGQPLGAQFRISATGDPAENSGVTHATVAWDASSDSFTVGWRANPGTGDLHAREFELFVQRVSPAGALLLAAEERVSFVGAVGGWRSYFPDEPGEFALATESALGGSVLVFPATDDLWFPSDDGVGLWSTVWGAAAFADADGDGVHDALDLCAGPDDVDGDGRAGCLLGEPFGDCDDLDPSVAGDRDADGACDRDDPCLGENSLGDADQDGVCDDLDVCLGDDALDVDGDGVPDACDPCPLDPYDDADRDGLCADLDLCFGHNGGGDADGNGVCDSQLVLLDPFAPGAPVRLRASRLPAGANATLIASPTLTPGHQACHPRSPAACTTLSDRIVVGGVVVNGAGDARWQITVPASVPSGRAFLMQAVWWEPGTGYGGATEVVEVVAQ